MCKDKRELLIPFHPNRFGGPESHVVTLWLGLKPILQNKPFTSVETIRGHSMKIFSYVAWVRASVCRSRFCSVVGTRA